MIRDKKRSVQEIDKDPLAWDHEADQLAETVLLANGDGVIVYSNHDLQGRVVTELLGANVFEMLPEEHREHLQLALKNVFQFSEPERYEVHVNRGAADERWTHVEVRPILQGDVVDIALIILADITERRKSAVLLANMERKLTVALSDVAKPEELITVCAWTKKVQMGGQWVSLEEFLHERFGMIVSHGITEEALEAEMEKFDKKMGEQKD